MGEKDRAKEIWNASSSMYVEEALLWTFSKSSHSAINLNSCQRLWKSIGLIHHLEVVGILWYKVRVGYGRSTPRRRFSTVAFTQPCPWGSGAAVGDIIVVHRDKGVRPWCTSSHFFRPCPYEPLLTTKIALDRKGQKIRLRVEVHLPFGIRTWHRSIQIRRVSDYRGVWHGKTAGRSSGEN